MTDSTGARAVRFARFAGLMQGVHPEVLPAFSFPLSTLVRVLPIYKVLLL